MSTEWATEDNELPYTPDLHIKGTIVKNRNGKTFTEFWMTRPRPEGISLDEWDKLEQEKWDRIFTRR